MRWFGITQLCRDASSRCFEKKLQTQVEQHGAVFPPERKKGAPSPPGNDATAHDLRQRWGLSAHQQLSPALEDKLAYFASVTGSYAAAAQLATKVAGCIS